MNEPLSIAHLIANAGPLVQGVMLLLLLASVLSWAIIVQRLLFYALERRNIDQFDEQFWSGIDLSQLYRQGHERAEAGRISGMESIFRAGFREFTRLRQQAGVDADAVMEGTQRAMRVATLQEEQKLNRYLAFLATVGSTSPYVGLFGTVWGIMNSFRGLANVQQATLATVAPGISEALIATAMGLFAAIPAVIAYNRFLAEVDVSIGRLDIFTDEFSSILHRQAHAAPGRTPREE